jgi:uncharacterized protein (TIGR01777 family)
MSGRDRYERRSPMPVDAAALGAWHFRAGAIHRLIPPWERIEVRREAAPLVDGARAEIVIRKGPIATTLVAVHEEVDPPRQFVDRQERGPFGSWRHRHRFIEGEGGGSVLEDSIAYDLPFGPLGALIRGPFRAELDRQFAFRHARTRADLRRHAEIAARFGARRLRVGVTGATGLVGTQLCAFLSTGGHEVVRFTRSARAGEGTRPWNPEDPERGLDPAHLADLDVVVHLAGESIAGGRWSAERKRRILESRTKGTATVARAIARAERRPEALLSASAIGFYGDRGDEALDERSGAGAGFLPDVVRAWEDATVAARDAGVRTVHMRFGVVLAAAGGALGKMLTPFRLGAGGPVGSGRQGMSWISLDDLVGAVLFAAPGAVAQREFARVLGRVLRRPAFAPLPAPVVRAIFGELGQRLLLEGAFVRPVALERAGFRFEHATLEDALRLELGAMRPN